jgi:hypothetical protein
MGGHLSVRFNHSIEHESPSPTQPLRSSGPLQYYPLPADIFRLLIKYMPLHTYPMFRSLELFKTAHSSIPDIDQSLQTLILDAIVRNDADYCRKTLNKESQLYMVSLGRVSLLGLGIISQDVIDTISNIRAMTGLPDYWAMSIMYGRIEILDIFQAVGRQTNHLFPMEGLITPISGYDNLSSHLDIAPDYLTFVWIWKTIQPTLSYPDFATETIYIMIARDQIQQLLWLEIMAEGSRYASKNYLYRAVKPRLFGNSHLSVIGLIKTKPEIRKIFVRASSHDYKVVKLLLD